MSTLRFEDSTAFRRGTGGAHEENGTKAADGVSHHLGELLTGILGMADVVKYAQAEAKEVQLEVAQLKQENRSLRRQQMLNGDLERTLRESAETIDSDKTGPVLPQELDVPHSPTEPPPDLGIGPHFRIGASKKADMRHLSIQSAEESEIARFSSANSMHSINSMNSDVISNPSSSATKDTVTDKHRLTQISSRDTHGSHRASVRASVQDQVRARLRRQVTYVPKALLKAASGGLDAWQESQGCNTFDPGNSGGNGFTSALGFHNGNGGGGGGGHRSPRDSAVRAMLFDPEALRHKVKDHLNKPEFDVSKFYHATGLAQRIVRSYLFETVSTAVIFLNVIWIAVDTEHNKADVLIQARVEFQIIEHCFCCFFLFEWSSRFCAFRKKRDCLRSGWFIFESILVITMVFEDWVVTFIIVCLPSSGDGEASIKDSGVKDVAMLRILRVMRLARLGRAIKLMQQSPEMMIMVKALTASARSVVWTCVLLSALVFVFGVCFTQICKDSALEEDYFGSLTSSLHTLMIAGIFPDLEVTSQTIKDTHFVYWLLFLVYLVLTGITVMNLLVGVLVEVAQSSAKIERNNLDANYVKNVFVEILGFQEVEDFEMITVDKEEFADLLQEPEILKALTKVGIDVFGLIDLMDFIFMNGSVGFVELLEAVLQLRSSADVTVRDLVEVRKFLTYELSKLHTEFSKLALGARENAKGHLS